MGAENGGGGGVLPSSLPAIEGVGLEAPLARPLAKEAQGLTDRESVSMRNTPLPVGTGLLPDASLFLIGALCTRRFRRFDGPSWAVQGGVVLGAVDLSASDKGGSGGGK